jgi:patatin-like phospholipase/acyl hydrolase
VRATSPATTYFKSIKCELDEVKFIDAGFGYNNPSNVLLQEARRLFPQAGNIQVGSIGTGLGNVVTIKNTRISILQALKTMASSSSRVAQEMEMLYRDSDNYFRFDVERGLEDVTLSDWEEISTITTHTHNYILEHESRLQRCALQLVRSNTRVPEASQHNAPEV